MGGGEIVALGAASKGLEAEMDEGARDWGELGREWKMSLYWGLLGMDPHKARLAPVGIESLEFYSGAMAELARLIDDVQKNRNRPEGDE